jgi:hypothetical protein
MITSFQIEYVYQGQGYWQRVESGWDLGNEAADVVYAEWNKPVFEWKYTMPWRDTSIPASQNPPGVWTHRMVTGPFTNAAAISPTPPTAPKIENVLGNRITDMPSGAGAARDAWTLEQIRNGNFTVQWFVVSNRENGHEILLQVFGDALKIDGVRIPISPNALQQTADMLGCLLQTPKIAMLKWCQRTVTIEPRRAIHSGGDGPVVDVGDMTAKDAIAQSNAIDQDIAKAIQAKPGSTSANVGSPGKDWYIDTSLVQYIQSIGGQIVAENGGWYSADRTIAPNKCVDAQCPCGMVQELNGWAHGIDHIDYSQLGVLVSRTCIVDGQVRDLWDVLQDPVLAQLVSHTGAMKPNALRQPGVNVATPLSCAVVSSSGAKVSKQVSASMSHVQQSVRCGFCPEYINWREPEGSSYGPPEGPSSTSWSTVFWTGVAAAAIVGGFYAAIRFAGKRHLFNKK